MLGWDRFGSHKKRTMIRYVKLMFLHLVGSVGHIVHSGSSRAQNVDTLFFIPGWAQCKSHKKRIETRYTKLVFLHPVGSMGHVVHSGASSARNEHTICHSRLGPTQIPQKACRNMLCRTCVLASGGIYRSRSGF
jgi:methionine aminopeptidase